MFILTFKKIHHYVYYALHQINKIQSSDVLDVNQININMSIIIDKHYNFKIIILNKLYSISYQ